jgi:hypothetical protein
MDNIESCINKIIDERNAKGMMRGLAAQDSDNTNQLDG